MRYGTGRCKHCGGDGVDDEGNRCKWCYGDGKCETCGGDGVIECDDCDGKGYTGEDEDGNEITCRYCGGSGKQSCPDC